MNLRRGNITLEIISVILVFSIFLFILLGYYSTALQKEEINPRFVDIDFDKLRDEAKIIGNPNLLINETAKSVFVLTYHVVSKNEPKDDYEISYDQFKENMFALKRLGYQTVNLEDFHLFLNGEKKLPDKSFLITFDDGAKTSFYNVDAILEVLNYTAVMFVITGNSFVDEQSPYYLNETELIMIHQTGRWELESHTHASHFKTIINEYNESGSALTNKIWVSKNNRFETDEEFFTRVSLDLEISKSILEDKLNKKVISFALPYGDFGDNNNYANADNIVYDLTSNLYELVFYQFPMKNNLFKGNYPSEKKESHLVTRFAADSLRTPEELLERINSTRVLELPYDEKYHNYNIWPTLSGQVSFKNESFTLIPLGDSIFTYLDGSYLWEDYEFSIRLDNDVVSTVSLITRLTLNQDYVSCQYTDQKIDIITLNQNVYEKLASASMPQNITLKAGTYLSMSVSGSKVNCFVNGYDAIGSEVRNISPNGGVGVKVEGFLTRYENFTFKEIGIKRK